MAKIPELTEATRGINVPNASIQARDHGQLRGIVHAGAAIGGGMVDIASYLAKQQAQEELSTNTVKFYKSITDIHAQAETMPASDAIDFVQRESDRLIQDTSATFKTELAKNEFQSYANREAIKLYDGFVKKKVAIEISDTRVRMAHSVQDAMRIGMDSLGITNAKAAVSAGIMTSEQADSIIQSEYAFRERELIVGAAGNTSQLSAIKDTIKTPSGRELFSRVAYGTLEKDKAAQIGVLQLKTYAEASNYVTDLVINGLKDAGDTRGMLNEILSKGQYNDEEKAKLVDHFSYALEKNHALRQIVSGAIVDFEPEDLRYYYPALNAQDLIEYSQMSKDDRKASATQDYLFSLVQQRIAMGRIGPQSVSEDYWSPIAADLKKMGLSDAQVMDVKRSAFESSLNEVSLTSLAKKGIVGPRHAGGLVLDLFQESAKQNKFNNDVEFINGIKVIRTQLKGQGSTILTDADKPRLDNNYRHNHLIDEEGNTHNSIFSRYADGGQKAIEAALLEVHKDSSILGMVPPLFVKEVEAVINTGNDHLAVTSAQSLQPFVTPGSKFFNPTVYQSIPVDVRKKIDVFAGLNVNSPTFKKDIDRARSRELVDASTESLWATVKGFERVQKAYQGAYGDKLDAPGEMVDDLHRFARDHFNDSRDLEGSIAYGMRELSTKYNTNQFGQVVYENVFNYNSQNINATNVVDQVIDTMLFKWQGWDQMSNDQLSAHIEKFIDTSKLDTLRPDGKDGMIHYKDAILKVPASASSYFPHKNSKMSNLSREEMMTILTYSGIVPRKADLNTPLGHDSYFEATNPYLSTKLKDYKISRTVIAGPWTSGKGSGGFFSDTKQLDDARDAVWKDENGQSIIRVDMPRDAKLESGQFQIFYMNHAFGPDRQGMFEPITNPDGSIYNYKPSPSKFRDTPYYYREHMDFGSHRGKPVLNDDKNKSGQEKRMREIGKTQWEDLEKHGLPFVGSGG